MVSLSHWKMFGWATDERQIERRPLFKVNYSLVTEENSLFTRHSCRLCGEMSWITTEWVNELGWNSSHWRLHHLTAAAQAAAPRWPQCCQMTVHESRIFGFYFYNLAGSDMLAIFIYVNGLNIEHLHGVWKDHQVIVHVRFWGLISK